MAKLLIRLIHRIRNGALAVLHFVKTCKNFCGAQRGPALFERESCGIFLARLIKQMFGIPHALPPLLPFRRSLRKNILLEEFFYAPELLLVQILCNATQIAETLPPFLHIKNPRRLRPRIFPIFLIKLFPVKTELVPDFAVVSGLEDYQALFSKLVGEFLKPFKLALAKVFDKHSKSFSVHLLGTCYAG